MKRDSLGNNDMFITFMLPSLQVLCSSPHKSQSLYMTLLVTFYISLRAK